MSIGETIVARASAPGLGRRAVVRVSGARTGAVLAALGVEDPGRRGAFCARASVLSGGDLPVLVVRFVGPGSYTGEDAAELLVPGNAHLVEMLLDRACGVEGVRRAGPGEFSARAYLAGKLTLAQAEGVAAKIAAEGASGLAAADRVLSGRAGAEHRAWAEKLAGLLALVEAGIDFSDQEDVVASGRGRRLGFWMRRLRRWRGRRRMSSRMRRWWRGRCGGRSTNWGRSRGGSRRTRSSGGSLLRSVLGSRLDSGWVVW